MAILHKNITAEADIHNPKWFPSANNGDVSWKNEKGELESTDELVLPAALDFVDASVAPPTTNSGDIYVLASGGGVNAGWGAVNLYDWVRYDGTDWNSITPQKSTLCYDEDTDALFSYDGLDWVQIGADSIYTDSGTVPSSVVATLTDTLTFEGDNSTTDVFKLGKIFTGAATSGVLRFQGSNTNYNAIEFFSAAATHSGGRNFAIGLDSIGYANVGGNNHLILSSNNSFSSTANRVWVRGSAGDVLFQANGRTYVSLKENGKMYIDPTSGYGLGIGLTSPEARLHVKGEHDDLVFRAETSGGVNVLDIDDLGNINMSNLPTTSAGLSSGDLWNDSGTLKIV